eukprot:scaffold222665_cov28-Tisochrysis_lutea.AAC.5
MRIAAAEVKPESTGSERRETMKSVRAKGRGRSETADVGAPAARIGYIPMHTCPNHSHEEVDSPDHRREEHDRLAVRLCLRRFDDLGHRVGHEHRYQRKRPERDVPRRCEWRKDNKRQQGRVEAICGR